MTITGDTAFTELRRNWRLVLACTIGFGLSLSGIPFYTLGVFVDPLNAAFGWSVGEVQFGLTVSYLTTIAVLPMVAWVADKVGVRAVALTCLPLLGVAFMAFGLQPGALWLYYLNWFLIALFGTGTLAIIWTRPLTRLLSAGRGLGLGLALMGTGVIGIFGPPVIRALIDAVGWRWAYVALGALPILVALPTTWLFFHDHTATDAPPPKGLAAPLRNLRLWVLGAIFGLVSLAVTGIIPNLVKLLTLEGLSRVDAAGAAGVVGLFVVLGRICCGALIDRFWAPAVASVFMLLAGGACVFLALGAITPATAMLAAACIGLAVGAEFDLMAFLASRYLPSERFTRSLAVISVFFYLGGAIGAPALAFFYDHYGSYRVGLLLNAGLFLVAVGGLLCLGRYPTFAEEPAAR